MVKHQPNEDAVKFVKGHDLENTNSKREILEYDQDNLGFQAMAWPLDHDTMFEFLLHFFHERIPLKEEYEEDGE